MTKIQGRVDEGWGKVADVFAANFDERDELGAACCVYAGGRPVVDIWAGVADKRDGRPWVEDTVVLVFSTTKGITAICAHMLAEQGLLDLDAPVVRYWPEFAAEGKDQILVRWLLSHQAGLPYVDTTLSLEETCAWDPVIRALEAQKPVWEPGTQHAYHALTYGWLVGEVIRRITGKTPGRYLADEVAGPLGLNAWIGLPEEQEARVAHIEAAPPLANEQLQQLLDTFTGADSLFGRAVLFSGLPIELVTDDGGFNARAVRAAEIPAGNLVTDARSLARVYAATVGDVDGVRLLRPDAVARATEVQTTSSTPYGMPPGMEEFALQASLGFAPPTALAPLLGPKSFGHGGAGGSLGVADADRGIGFGYVMNQMLTEIPVTPRAHHLLAAVETCAG